MTLTIHTEQDDKRQLLVTIEVPEERVQAQMRETARKLGRDIRLPGFRPGKAPYHVIESRVGREALRGEAVEDMVQTIFQEALDQINPDVYAQAQFDDLQLEPLVMKFTIPLTPEVDLGDYRAIRQEVQPVEVTAEAVERALELLRERYKSVEDVERPSALGDQVILSGRGELILEEIEDDIEDEDEDEEEAEDQEHDHEHDHDHEEEQDEVLFDDERLEFILNPETLFPGTPFAEELVGLSVGDTKEFSFTFPEDYQDESLAGKEASFNISVLQVQECDLPAIDELAEKEGVETMEALREKVEQDLFRAAQKQAQDDLMNEMIHAMMHQATMVYPPAAVEEVVHSRVDSFKNQVTRSGWEWEDYLKLQATSEEQLHENFHGGAEHELQHQLILRQFILNEKLSIKMEDVEAAIEERVGMYKENEMLANSMRQFYQQGTGLDMISSEILMQKVAERMEAIATGNAPSLEEPEAEETDTAVETENETVTVEETEPTQEADTAVDDKE